MSNYLQRSTNISSPTTPCPPLSALHPNNQAFSQSQFLRNSYKNYFASLKKLFPLALVKVAILTYFVNPIKNAILI